MQSITDTGLREQIAWLRGIRFDLGRATASCRRASNVADRRDRAPRPRAAAAVVSRQCRGAAPAPPVAGTRWREMDLALRALGVSPRQVDLHRAELQPHAGLGRPRRAAQRGTDARQQFADRKRFGHVVVGACVQRRDLCCSSTRADRTTIASTTTRGCRARRCAPRHRAGRGSRITRSGLWLAASIRPRPAVSASITRKPWAVSVCAQQPAQLRGRHRSPAPRGRRSSFDARLAPAPTGASRRLRQVVTNSAPPAGSLFGVDVRRHERGRLHGRSASPSPTPPMAPSARPRWNFSNSESGSTSGSNPGPSSATSSSTSSTPRRALS